MTSSSGRVVVIAPNKFKGSLTARQAAAALAAGVTDTCPELHVVTCPIADGGEGTVDAAVASGFRPRRAQVRGPSAIRWRPSSPPRGRLPSWSWPRPPASTSCLRKDRRHRPRPRPRTGPSRHGCLRRPRRAGPEDPDGDVVMAMDVDNPLFGPRGAAAVFGPQKGATAEQVLALDEDLRHWSRVLAEAGLTSDPELPAAEPRVRSGTPPSAS